MTTRRFTCLAAAASMTLGLSITAGAACDQEAKAATAAHGTKSATPATPATSAGCEKPCCAKTHATAASKVTEAQASGAAVVTAKQAESPCAAAKATEAPCAAKAADGAGCPKKPAAQVADAKAEPSAQTVKADAGAGPGTNR